MRKLIFLLPFAVLTLGSCLKDNSVNTPVTITVPVGTFAGQFRRIHRSGTTGKLDTAKAAFTLVMNKDTSYVVTADTTTIHNGSKGKFQITTNYINFIDSTYPKTGTPTKTHLAGTYLYAYDGSIFQLANLTSPNDTLAYQYDLKKIF